MNYLTRSLMLMISLTESSLLRAYFEVEYKIDYGFSFELFRMGIRAGDADTARD
jgi:hypothetical protein